MLIFKNVFNNIFLKPKKFGGVARRIKEPVVKNGGRQSQKAVG